MAIQIQTYQAGVGADPGQYPQRVHVDNSVGDALSQVGGAITQEADRAQALRDQQQRLHAEIGLQGLNEQLGQDSQNLQKNAKADGAGFEQDFVSKSVQPNVSTYLSGITDPKLKEEFTLRANLLAKTHADQANHLEYVMGNKFSVNATQQTQDKMGAAIVNDPANFSNYKQQVNELIDSAPLLTSEQRMKMKSDWTNAAPALLKEALKASDPETFAHAVGATTPEQRMDYLAKNAAPLIGKLLSSNPKKAEGFSADNLKAVIAKNKGDIGAAVVSYLGNENDLAAYKKDGPNGLSKELQASVGAVMGGLGTKIFAAGPSLFDQPAQQNKIGSADNLSVNTIKNFEQFRSRPYWDVNHWRVGYGSDTVTRADGTVENVTPNTVVTRQEADADIVRRTAILQRGIVQSIGKDAWGNMTAGQQAALSSVAYNYGSLPERVVSAVKTGSAAAIADAIHGLGSDNGGVNAGRRAREAALALNHSAPDIIQPATETTVAADNAATKGGGGQATVQNASFSLGEKPFVSASFDGISPVSMAEARAQGYALINKKDQAAKIAEDMLKFQTASQVTNDIASINQGGKPVVTDAQMPQFEQSLLQAHGADAVLKYRQDRANAIQAAEYSKDLAGMPADAITARLAQLEPSSGANAAAQKVVYDQVKANAQKELEARKADPATYVIKNDPSVAAAWKNFNPADPATAAPAIAATIAAQGKLGLDRAPLPAAQASQVAKLVADDTKATDARLGAVYGIVSQTTDPAQQQAIMNQLVKQGMPEGVATAVTAAQRGDTGAARRLFEAANLKPSDVPKAKTEEVGLDADLTEAMFGSGTVGQAYFGLDYNDPSAQKRASRDFEVAKVATLIAVRNGMSLDAAINQSVGDIIGKQDRVSESLPNGGNINGVVSQGTDTEALKLGMTAAMQDVRSNLGGMVADQVSKFEAENGKNGSAVINSVTKMHVENVITHGAFRPMGDGWGFFDPYSNSFVGTKDGKAMKWSTQQLLDMAPAQKANDQSSSDYGTQRMLEIGAGQ